MINQFNSLNKRTLAIVAALALPVVLLAVIIHGGPPKAAPVAAAANANAAHPNIPPHPTLEQARQATKARLEQVKKMTPEQWVQERKARPWVAPTVQAAIAYNTSRLTQLNAMTPEQWEAQFRPKPPTQKNSPLNIIPQPATSQKPNLPPTTR